MPGSYARTNYPGSLHIQSGTGEEASATTAEPRSAKLFVLARSSLSHKYQQKPPKAIESHDAGVEWAWGGGREGVYRLRTVVHRHARLERGEARYIQDRGSRSLALGKLVRCTCICDVHFGTVSYRTMHVQQQQQRRYAQRRGSHTNTPEYLAAQGAVAWPVPGKYKGYARDGTGLHDFLVGRDGTGREAIPGRESVGKSVGNIFGESVGNIPGSRECGGSCRHHLPGPLRRTRTATRPKCFWCCQHRPLLPL